MAVQRIEAVTESDGSALHEGRIDADAVAAYALATNDHNPVYQKGQAVPPLFTATMILPAVWEVQRVRRPDRRTVRGAAGSVHGEHVVICWGPARPGDQLRWQATTHGAHSRRGGVVVTQRVLVTDRVGNPVIEHLWSNFHLRGVIDEDFGPQPPDHAFPEKARALPFGTRAVTVDRDQAWRYAGVSGDRAPHALDEEQAQREGYPTKILQGMCTFGLSAGAVVDLAAAGDPTRIRRLAGRFSAPAFPKKDLVINMFDAGHTEEGGRSLAFEVLQDGVTVIRHGRVDLVPD